MKKKTLALLVMSMVMVLLLTACGGSNPKSNEALDSNSKTTEKYPVKPINIVVPFAAVAALTCVPGSSLLRPKKF